MTPTLMPAGTATWAIEMLQRLSEDLNGNHSGLCVGAR
jgi:hypothetical protein